MDYEAIEHMLSCFRCVWLCDPADSSLPVSSVHGVLQARILEQVTNPPPGYLPDPGIEPGSPVSFCIGSRHFTTSATWKPYEAIDLKQMYCQIFLNQWQVYLESTENCSLGSATMASYRQVPAEQGKKHTLTEEKRKRPLVKRVHGFSLAES